MLLLHSPKLSPALSPASGLCNSHCTEDVDIKLLTVNLRVWAVLMLSTIVHFVYTMVGKYNLKKKDKKKKHTIYLILSKMINVNLSFGVGGLQSADNIMHTYTAFFF